MELMMQLVMCMFQLSANSILDLLQRMVAACEFHNY
jgi:hypothetical protein